MHYANLETGVHCFTFRFPGPGPVSLVGDFNDWTPDQHPLSDLGCYWLTAISLCPGRYRYGFSVRGAIFRDPDCTKELLDEGWPWSLAICEDEYLRPHRKTSSESKNRISTSINGNRTIVAPPEFR